MLDTAHGPAPDRPPSSSMRRRASPPAERVTRIVELFIDRPERRWTLSAIVGELDLSIATVHAILQTLVDRGWIVRHTSDKSYALGPTLVAAGRAASTAAAGLAVLEGAVGALAAALGTVCAASRIDGDDLLIVAQGRPTGVDDHATRVGQRIPYAAPFGVSFAAYADDASTASWFDRSPLGISAAERSTYAEVFEGIRARGYGVERFDALRTRLHDALVESRDETMTPAVLDRIREIYPLIGLREFLPAELRDRTLDVAMVHAPVFAEHARPAFNLTVHVRRTQVPRREIERLGAQVCAEAERCTAILRGDDVSISERPRR